MANIMLTDACNLSCPYCFASEFVNKKRNEISMDNFSKALEFILKDGSTDSVGLIGGEPLLHSRFEELVRKLIMDSRVKSVLVYTNGILLDRYKDILSHKKIHILVNCNSPSDIGDKNYNKMIDNLDYYINHQLVKDNINLGINMYKPEFDYDYIINTLVKFKYNRVRVSISVPDADETKNIYAFNYFLSIKDRMLDFFEELLANGVVPHFDCNKIPYCLLSEDDVNRLKKYMKNEEICNLIKRSNILDEKVQCKPVIDICQDLTAVRCFGLSQYTKESIMDYTDLTELTNYYYRTIDAYACNSVHSKNCAYCKRMISMKCSGGCLVYKIDNILKLRHMADNQMK